jgi:hypothetical protein
LIAENDETCVRIVAIFVLTQETFDRTDATCGQMLVSVIETFLNSEETDMKELHVQNCAPIGETSGATRVTFGKTVVI